MCADHWRDVFRLEVPWRLGLFVQGEGAYCMIHWLHVAEGFQNFCRAGALPEVVSTWVKSVKWIQLQFFGALLGLYMHEDLLPRQGFAVLRLPNSIYEEPSGYQLLQQRIRPAGCW